MKKDFKKMKKAKNKVNIFLIVKNVVKKTV